MYRILDDRITAEIFIMGVIGDEGLRSMDFTQELHKAEAEGAKQFICRINSPGGEVFEAIGIFNALAERNVTVSIEGLAASSASFIAMAGKQVKMFDNALLMIHNPWTFAAGDANYFEKVQENLEMIKGVIMKAYSRTGLSDKQLTKMMDEETWLSAQEAKEKKFVDEVVESNQAPQNKSRMIAQYYNRILDESLFTRKVNQMMKIQTALNLPGADEDKLAQGILALQKVKNEQAAEVEVLKADVVKKQGEIADKEKELGDLKVKLEALEKEKSQNAEAQAVKQAEEILDKAVADGKVFPAEIDPASEEGKKTRQAYIDRIKMNAKVFDAMPVINKLGKSAVQNQSGSVKNNDEKRVTLEARKIVEEARKNGSVVNFTDAVKQARQKLGIS